MTETTGSKRLVSFDGVQIFYSYNFTHGRDRVLFFVHGLGGDLTSWKMERKLLHGLGYSTVAMDLRGHGFSERCDDASEYTIQGMAKDVMQIVQKERITKMALVGHSLGGMIGMYLASLHPKQLKALVLLDSSYKAPEMGTKLADSKLVQWLLERFAGRASLRHIHRHKDQGYEIKMKEVSFVRWVSDIAYMSLRSYLLLSRKLIEFNGQSLLEQIQVPTLVVAGDEDKLFPPAIQRKMAKRIKGATLNYIPGANHIVILISPREIAESIDQYLTGHKVWGRTSSRL